MKILKVLSASAVAAAIAASVTVPASAATTYKDAVAAAEECGVQAHNVQQLENFLEANDDYFTSDEYDEMIEDLQGVYEDYVVPAAEALGYDATSLTEDQKAEIGRSWTEDERNAIIADLQALGADYGVTITVTKSSDNVGFDVYASIDDDDNSGSSSSSSSSSSTTDSTKKDPAVAPTGGDLGTGSNATAVAFGGIATLLAATGIVVVAKKNKD